MRRNMFENLVKFLETFFSLENQLFGYLTVADLFQLAFSIYTFFFHLIHFITLKLLVKSIHHPNKHYNIRFAPIVTSYHYFFFLIKSTKFFEYTKKSNDFSVYWLDLRAQIFFL